jgi:hypothetical protein
MIHTEIQVFPTLRHFLLYYEAIIYSNVGDLVRRVDDKIIVFILKFIQIVTNNLLVIILT